MPSHRLERSESGWRRVMVVLGRYYQISSLLCLKANQTTDSFFCIGLLGSWTAVVFGESLRSISKLSLRWQYGDQNNYQYCYCFGVPYKKGSIRYPQATLHLLSRTCCGPKVQTGVLEFWIPGSGANREVQQLQPPNPFGSQ